MAVIVSSTSIVLTELPMPCSENNAYFNNRQTGGRSPSRELKEFKARVAEWAMADMGSMSTARGILDLWGAVSLQALVGFRRDRIFTKDSRMKRIDSANFLKVLQDGVAKAIGRDDCFFWRSSVEKAPLKIGDDRERCTVILTQAPTIDLVDWHKALFIV